MLDDYWPLSCTVIKALHNGMKLDFKKVKSHQDSGEMCFQDLDFKARLNVKANKSAVCIQQARS